MPNNKNWDQKKEELKERYSTLEEDEVMYEPGKEAQLIGQLQEKLAMSREEIKQILQKL